MSRDGLVLASSAVGGAREPSAVMFTVFTVTLGAAILNQTTMASLCSSTAIASQILTAACNVEWQYRPYNCGDAIAPSRSRRNRNRKLNYKSRTAACDINSTGRHSGAESVSQSSGTVTTVADVHSTAPEMTSSNRPDVIDVASADYNSFVDSAIAEDDDNELVSGRDGRAGSGNHPTGSASSSSSDTDIDEVVDEFEQRRAAAVAQARADDQLIDIRCADDVTHRRAVRAVVAFTASGLVLFGVTAHAPRPGHPVSVVACVLAGLGCLASVVCLARLPHSDVTLMTSSRVGNSSGVRWVALLSLAVHCCLLAAVTGTSSVVALLWVVVGEYSI